MSAPLSRILSDVDTPAIAHMRNIENHYHLGMVAQNTRDIADFQRASLAVQVAAARETNSRLADMGYSMAAINDALGGVALEMAGIREGVSELQATAQRTEDVLYDMNATLDSWLSNISQQIEAQQRTLSGIADTLRRPLETTVQEMRRHADHALKSGMRSTGPERSEWYGDAMELLQAAVQNPIGKQDYVAWFQIGWLQWKADDDLEEAETALSRATRLSAPHADAYYVESLRHLAYVRYLRGNKAGAFEAITQALQAHTATETLFDAARYAAVNGRAAQAIELLERCIRQEPVAIIQMAPEPDFVHISQETQELIARLLSEARSRAGSAVDRWSEALGAAHAWQEEAGLTIPIPSELSTNCVDRARNRVRTADYLTALEIEREAYTADEGVFQLLDRELTCELKARTEAATAAKAAVSRAQRDAERA